MNNILIGELFEVLFRTFAECELFLFDPSGAPLYGRPDGGTPPAPPESCPFTAFYADRRFELAESFPGGLLLMRGVCADRADLETIGRMARGLLAFFQEPTAPQRKSDREQNSILELTNRLFNASTPESVAYVALWAINLGFDLTLPRTVCLFDIASNETNADLRSRIRQSIIGTIRSFPDTSAQDIVSATGSRQIVLCKTLTSREASPCGELYPYLSALCASLMERYSISVRVGVGGVPKGIDEFGNSLRDAQTALQYAQLFSVKQSINFIGDYALEQEVSRLPPETLHHFFDRHLRLLASSSQLSETLEALIRSNMDVNATADYLFVHRNTAIFRINQLKKRFHLNPLHSDRDRFMLMVLYIYSKFSGQPGA